MIDAALARRARACERGAGPAASKEGHMATITEREAEQVERANASGRTPVVFIHGLWLLPSSWDNWARASSRRPATRR